MKHHKEFHGATSFRDRHGVRRWRYLEKGFTAQLGKDYGSADFVRNDPHVIAAYLGVDDEEVDEVESAFEKGDGGDGSGGPS